MTPPASREFARPLLFTLLLLTVLLWAFGPTVLDMAERWQNDSRYAHGYLVPLFSLFLVWWWHPALLKTPARPSWWGLLILLGGLLTAAAGAYLYVDWFSAVGLVICVAGIVVLAWGFPMLGAAWPAVAFLLFMVPLPYTLEVSLARPLQSVAARLSTWSLQTVGFSAFAEGNTIRMGEVRLGVVEACSGLSMLLTFFALCAAVAVLIKAPLWERLLVVACAAPIAVLSNVVRIVVTGVLHKLAGQKIADLVFHDLAGWLMMPLALGFLWVAYRLYSWAFPLVPSDEDDVPYFAGAAQPE